MSEIAKLLERVKSASGPDRDIDHDIMLEIEPSGWHTVPGSEDDRYTGSTDAALALTERVLPGWAYRIHSVPGAMPQCGLSRSLMEGYDGHARTVPLAILVALLTALQDQRHEQ